VTAVVASSSITGLAVRNKIRFEFGQKRTEAVCAGVNRSEDPSSRFQLIRCTAAVGDESAALRFALLHWYRVIERKGIFASEPVNAGGGAVGMDTTVGNR
jgi:hypothetical protein